MAKKIGDIAPSKKVPRESDNPIVEEYKDDLRSKPGYGVRPGGDDEVRLSRLEGLLGDMQEKLQDLDRRIKAIEVKK
jgi:hypothetical protein